MLTMIIEADGEAPRTLRLTQFPSRIGRLRDSPVRLSSWRVAGVHAEIHRIERGFKLVDCGSLGGTWVNGERIVEYAPLGDDDEISIAGFRLRVHPALRLSDAAGDRPASATGRIQAARPRADRRHFPARPLPPSSPNRDWSGAGCCTGGCWPRSICDARTSAS